MTTLLKTICESAFTTKENGNLNIIGIFEHINAPGFPAVHHKMTFIWSIDNAEANKDIDYYFNIKDPNGGIVVDGKNKPAKSTISPNGKINLIFNVINVKLPIPGKYIVNLFAGDFGDSLEFEAKLILASGAIV